MKKFNWTAFADEDKNKIAVWCKTEEEAKDFCKQSHEHGYDWIDGESRENKTNWDNYEKETVYAIDTFCDRKYFVEDNYTILPWSQYMKNQTELILSDEEIFEMLRPKIEKNGITIPNRCNQNSSGWCTFSTLISYNQLTKLVSTIYKSGYFRAEKGRPFDVKEK